MKLINSRRGLTDSGIEVYCDAVLSGDGIELIENLDKSGMTYIREDFLPYLRKAVREWEKRCHTSE